MLQFNPYFRPSAKELLGSCYFNDVRISKLENFKPSKLLLACDQDEYFDLDLNEVKLSKDELLGMLHKRIQVYQKI